MLFLLLLPPTTTILVIIVLNNVNIFVPSFIYIHLKMLITMFVPYSYLLINVSIKLGAKQVAACDSVSNRSQHGNRAYLIVHSFSSAIAKSQQNTSQPRDFDSLIIIGFIKFKFSTVRFGSIQSNLNRISDLSL